MPDVAWWQRGAIYQIYPRSFADSDGDGSAICAGIAAHLDHLAALGVEAIWLSPFFRSPMADFGYDVSDYCDVDPVFGTLADFDALVATCHARDIRVVIDWVPNHTSDQHPWFEESRVEPRQPEARLVRVARRSGGRRAAERLDVAVRGRRPGVDVRRRPRGQWYLHSFMPEQPDLNWDNPEVEAAMHDVLRFWMDRGVDGFRLDAIHKIAKDPLLRDHVGAPRRHDEDWDTIHERLRGIRRVIDEYDDRMLVGEVALQDLHRVVGYLDVRRPAAPRAQLRLRRAAVGRRRVPHLDRRLRGARRSRGVAGLVPLQPRQVARRDPLRRRGPGRARRGR